MTAINIQFLIGLSDIHLYVIIILNLTRVGYILDLRLFKIKKSIET